MVADADDAVGNGGEEAGEVDTLFVFVDVVIGEIVEEDGVSPL